MVSSCVYPVIAPKFPVCMDKRQVFHLGIGQRYAIHAGTGLCTSAELIQDLCHPLKSIILSYVFHPNSYACRRESISRQQLSLSGLIRNFCFNQFLYISHGFLGTFPHGYADKLFESSHGHVEANQLKAPAAVRYRSCVMRKIFSEYDDTKSN